MSAEDQKAANEKDDAGQRGPTRRQFLAGMAAAGAGLVATTSGTAGAASLVARQQHGRSSPYGARVAARSAG